MKRYDYLTPSKDNPFKYVSKIYNEDKGEWIFETVYLHSDKLNDESKDLPFKLSPEFYETISFVEKIDPLNEALNNKLDEKLQEFFREIVKEYNVRYGDISPEQNEDLEQAKENIKFVAEYMIKNNR